MAKTDRGYGPLDNHMYMYDLGWLVKTILGFQEELDTAIDLKTIHYADPIQWDITTQYSPNTVVVDPKTGTAYMSKVPVPAGIQLDNTDYWVVIFNYQRIYDKIMSGVAFNDKENAEASKDISRYDFVWFGGDLYQAQRDIPQGSKYVPGVNIVATTIADALATYYGRDRVAQVINDTLTASETQTIRAKNRVISVTGDQTITAGDIAETSANRTIKTTVDYHIDVDGTTASTYGGVVTETYKSEHSIKATDASVTASGNVTASANQFELTSVAKSFPIHFPDKTVDLYNITNDLIISVKDYGAKGDGENDDYAAIQSCIDRNPKRTIYFPSGVYNISKPLVINVEYTCLLGENRNTRIVKTTTSGIADYSFIHSGETYDMNDINCILAIIPKKNSNNGSAWRHTVSNLTFLGDGQTAYGIYSIAAPYTIFKEIVINQATTDILIDHSYSIDIILSSFNSLLDIKNSTNIKVTNSQLTRSNALNVFSSTKSLINIIGTSLDIGVISGIDSIINIVNSRTESAKTILYAKNSYITASGCNFEKHQDESATEDTPWFQLINSQASIVNSVLRFQNYSGAETWSKSALWSVDNESILKLFVEEKDMLPNKSYKQPNVIHQVLNKIVGDIQWVAETTTNFTKAINDGYGTRINFSITFKDDVTYTPRFKIGTLTKIAPPNTTVIGFCRIAPYLYNESTQKILSIELTSTGEILLQNTEPISNAKTISGSFFY